MRAGAIAVADLRPGDRVAGYELVERAGAGGFCVVWRARRPGEADARYALKLPVAERFVAHLRREARVRAYVHDPRVVPVLEAHLESDPPFLVLPWIEGRPLALPDAPPAPRRILGALELALDLAHVVAGLHAGGIAHGDLKPGNVLVDAAGRCHVLDLGLTRAGRFARRETTLARSLASVDGRSIAGTLDYMAPEVMSGAAPGRTADVYALGVLLHHLLAGRPPAFGVSPRALNPYLPPGTVALLRRMLRSDPAGRCPSAILVVPELEELVRAERRCLARPHGHERRRVRQRCLEGLRRARAVLAPLVLAALAAPFLATLAMTAEHVSIAPGVPAVLAALAGAGALALGLRSTGPRERSGGRTAAPENPGLAGRVLSGYRLVERVARGSFCDVWRGVHELRIHGDPGAAVAIKVATDATGARLLRAEAEATAALDDPRVAPVLAFAPGPVPHLVRPWYVATLRDRPSVEALLEVVEIVAAVHARGFRHGDLKPENVFLDARGRPVLADLGLARKRPAAPSGARLGHSLSLETRGGLTGGTLAYMAPEAARGGEPSPAGDVFALGVMLHEALLGGRPDRAADPDEVRRSLPPGAFDVLARALALDPADRYEDAGALLAALAPSLARAPSAVSRGARAVGRVALRALCASCVVLTAVAAAIVGIAVVLAHPLLGASFGLAAASLAALRREGPGTPR